jgi:RNA polymerase sigma factor (sigma-70 family)
MTRRWFHTFTQYQRQARDVSGDLRSDAELLELFRAQHDQNAFELLVWRHGSMVWGVCLRVLGDPHEAEDAFQATFLVFVRKAHSIGRRESVGSWLYKVAYRISSRLRAQSTRRPAPAPVPEMAAEPDGMDEPSCAVEQRELLAILDEEVQGLPEKYRTPLVLHFLLGRTCREVAQELDWPLGTVATRLTRARGLLQERLARRGIAPALALILGTPAGANAVTARAALIATTVRAAWNYAAGASGAAGVSATRSVLLAEGVLHAMRLSKWKIAAALVGIVLFGGGAFWGLRLGIASEHAATADEPPRPVELARDDWPTLGGSSFRNMVNLTSKKIPDEIDDRTGKNIKWKAALGSRALGGPVVAGGRIFVGTNNENPRDARVRGDRGVILCFEEATGKFLWQAAHPKLPAGRVNDWPQQGITSTPTIDGDRLYYLSNRCTVVCARTAGKEGKSDIVWECDLITQFNVFPHEKSPCSPLVVGDLVFVVSSNGVDEGHVQIPAPEAPSFLALNKKTGNVVWKDSSPGKNILHTQWSSPAYAEIGGKPQVIFPGGDGWLRAFEPATGKLLWKFDANPKNAKYLANGKGTRNDFLAMPVVHEGRVYIGVGQDPEHGDGVGHLWCIDPAQPKAIPADRDISPELVTDATVDPPLMKANPASGVVWHYGGPDARPGAARPFHFGRTMSTCAVHDGLVYAAELNGYLHCLEAKTGRVLWVHDLKAAVQGSPLWVDGKVYLGTDDGDLWVFEHGKAKPTPKQMELGGPIRTTPVVANGVLYVMTNSTLFAIAPK